MKKKGLIENWLVRSLTKVGGKSYAVTLPINIIRQFGWRERQKLQITIDGENRRIIISDWKSD